MKAVSNCLPKCWSYKACGLNATPRTNESFSSVFASIYGFREQENGHFPERKCAGARRGKNECAVFAKRAARLERNCQAWHGPAQGLCPHHRQDERRCQEAGRTMHWSAVSVINLCLSIYQWCHFRTICSKATQNASWLTIRPKFLHRLSATIHQPRYCITITRCISHNAQRVHSTSGGWHVRIMLRRLSTASSSLKGLEIGQNICLTGQRERMWRQWTQCSSWMKSGLMAHHHSLSISSRPISPAAGALGFELSVGQRVGERISARAMSAWQEPTSWWSYSDASPNFEFGYGPDFEGDCWAKECHGRRGVSGRGTGAAGGSYALCSFPTSPAVGRRIFLCVRRGTISCHRRRRVAVIGTHNTENTTVSPKCCRATVSRRWRRHSQLPRSRWAVTKLFLPGTRRYKDTLQNVFSFNPNMVPQDVPVDNVFGGELMALCHETQKEDRHPSLPGSGVLGSALRHTEGGVLGGVAHSPLVEAGRARESAQRWGTYMSLTSPPICQYRPEYYKVHYSADVPEAEVLQPQQLYSTSSFLAIAKGTPPTDFRIRHSLLRYWEGLQRASLGVINHLDWFLSTVWKMVGAVEVEPQMRANIDNMLTSSSVAVNHLAHMQARLLAGNAAFRREGLLDASVLDRAGAQFLRSQPIGGADLFAGKVPEALRVASEDRNKQLLFQAAVKPAGRGAAGSPHGPPVAVNLLMLTVF